MVTMTQLPPLGGGLKEGIWQGQVCSFFSPRRYSNCSLWKWRDIGAIGQGIQRNIYLYLRICMVGIQSHFIRFWIWAHTRSSLKLSSYKVSLFWSWGFIFHLLWSMTVEFQSQEMMRSVRRCLEKLRVDSAPICARVMIFYNFSSQEAMGIWITC